MYVGSRPRDEAALSRQIQVNANGVGGFHKRPVRPLQCLRQPSRDSNSGLKYPLEPPVKVSEMGPSQQPVCPTASGGSTARDTTTLDAITALRHDVGITFMTQQHIRLRC